MMMFENAVIKSESFWRAVSLCCLLEDEHTGWRGDERLKHNTERREKRSSSLAWPCRQMAICSLQLLTVALLMVINLECHLALKSHYTLAMFLHRTSDITQEL